MPTYKITTTSKYTAIKSAPFLHIHPPHAIMRSLIFLNPDLLSLGNLFPSYSFAFPKISNKRNHTTFSLLEIILLKFSEAYYLGLWAKFCSSPKI